MARLRPFFTELFQRAMGGWRRERRSSGDFRFAASVYALPPPEINREALLRIFGVIAAAPEAEARGLRLLRENLSPAQREQQERYGCFDVRGGDTGRHYRIKDGFQLNVQLLDNKGRTTAVLCFMPAGNLVAGDVMLAQKLALELFESDTLKIANKFSVNRYWT
jgi:hypothetical protein